MWCPNCKTEYRDGVTVCSDCGAELVPALPVEFEDLVRVAAVADETEANLLADFLESEGITGLELVEAEEEIEGEMTTVIQIDVPANQEKKALQLATVFLSGEAAKEAQKEFQEMTDEEKAEKLKENHDRQEAKKNIHVFESATEKYKDNLSSGQTFTIFGCLGLVFLGLNMAGILHIFHEPFQYIIAGLMFIAFIGFGLLSFKKAKQYKEAISAEADLGDAVKNWLAENITAEKIASFTEEDPDAPEEAKEILIIGKIHDELMAAFPDLDSNYADQLVDTFYEETQNK